MPEPKIFTHLKNHAYYNELYDKFTIEECQDWENKKHELEDLSKLSEKEKKLERIKKKYLENAFFPMIIYFVKGERCAGKSETIRKWMERDEAKDEKSRNIWLNSLGSKVKKIGKMNIKRWI